MHCSIFRYLLVECEEQDSTDPEKRRCADMYITVMKRFSYALLKGDRQCRIRRLVFVGSIFQYSFFGGLSFECIQVAYIVVLLA